MKKVAVLLVTTMVFLLCACNSGTVESTSSIAFKKLNGIWEYHSSSTNSIGETSVRDYIYYFDENSNLVRITLVRTPISFMGQHVSYLRSLYVHTGSYSVDDLEITVTFTHEKHYSCDSITDSVELAEADITETDRIPYYISEYSHELVFNTDAVGNSEYTYRKADMSREDFIAKYEESWRLYV